PLTVGVTFAPVPALVAGNGALGATLDLVLASPPFDSFFLALGVPGDPLPSLAGTLFLEPASLVPLVFGQQASSGRFPLSLAVPKDRGRRGRPVALQAASEFALQKVVVLTTPALVVLH